MMIVRGRNNFSRRIRLSPATPISLEITMPALSPGQMRYVESGEGSSGTANGSKTLHSSWMMSVSIRSRIRGSPDTDFSFRGCFRTGFLEGCSFGQLDVMCPAFVGSGNATDGNFVGSTYHLSVSFVGIGSPSGAVILGRVCGRSDVRNAVCQCDVAHYEIQQALS